MYKGLGILVGVFTLLGCASIPEEECSDVKKCNSAIVTKPAVPGVNAGVVYSLPHQNIKFSLKRVAVTKATLKKAEADAKTALDSAKAKVKSRKAAIKVLEGVVKAAASGTDTEKEAKAKKELELEIEKLYLVGEENKQKSANVAYEKAKRENANFKKEHVKDSVSLSALSPVPGEQKLVAKNISSELSSETLEIKTTPEGLLSSSTGALVGQADEILVAFVSALQSVSVTQGIVGSKTSLHSIVIEDLVTPAAICNNEPVEFEYVFDPYALSEFVDPGHDYSAPGTIAIDELKLLNTALRNKGICYELKLSRQKTVPNSGMSLDVENKNFEGLLYPRMSGMSFDLLQSRDGTAYNKVQSLFVNVVDTSVIGVLPVHRSTFADNDVEFEFKNGLLTRYKSVTPSEVLSFLQLFPAAAKAVVSIPAEIIQLKIDYSSKEAAYYDAQAAIIEARQNLEAVESAGADEEEEAAESE